MSSLIHKTIKYKTQRILCLSPGTIYIFSPTDRTEDEKDSQVTSQIPGKPKIQVGRKGK